MSLLKYKKYILFALCLAILFSFSISPAQAATFELTHNLSLTDQGTNANCVGALITTKDFGSTTYYLDKVYINPGQTKLDTMYLYNWTSDVLVATAIGNMTNGFYFNNITLSKNQDYALVTKISGAPRSGINSGTPLNAGVIAWTGVAYHGGAGACTGAGLSNLTAGVYIVSNITLQTPSAAGSNATIQATDAWTGNYIYNISALINGTTYNSNVSSGIITLPFLSNTTTNQTIVVSDNTGKHYSNTTTNYNISSSLIVKLTNTTTTFYVNDSYNGSLVSNFSIIYNGTTYWSNTTSKSLTIEFKNSTYQSLENGSSTFNITVDGYDGYGYFEQTLTNVNQSSNTTLFIIPTVNKYVFVKDSSNNLITSICTYNGNNIFGSTFLLSTYNITNLIFSCEAQGDYQAGSITLTNTSTNQTLTLQPYSLILYFNVITNVSVAQSNGTFTNYQNTNSFTFRQSNLSEGDVIVYFGKNATTGSNATVGQHYEYINDQSTQINETIQIINNPTEPFWISAQTVSAQGISDAYIRVYEINQTSGTYVSTLVGQYISVNRNPTLVYLDTSKRYNFITTKTGYQTRYLLNFDPNDNPYTSTNPYLAEMTSNNGNDILTLSATTVPSIITNTSQDIRFSISHPSATRAYYLTTYRQANGASLNLGITNISGNASYYGPLYNYAGTMHWSNTLEPNVDFASGQTSPINITVYLYYNGAWTSFAGIITPYAPNTTWINITPPTSSSDTSSNNWMIIFWMLGTIITAGYIRYRTQNVELSTTIYHIGLAITGFIVYYPFILVTTIVALYYIGKYTKKIGGDES